MQGRAMAYKVRIWTYGFTEEYEPLQMKLRHFQQESRRELDQEILRLSRQPACADFIHKKYVKDELAQNGILAVIYQAQVAQGFIMARPLADGGIYLDVLCANPGTGSVLLRFFLRLMELRGAAYVELNSLINVLAYYPQFGFEHRLSCEGRTPLRMPISLTEHLKRGKKTGRLRTYKNYYKDPATMQFVGELHRRGFTRTRNPTVCKNRGMLSDNFQQHHCARDGFVMRKCFMKST